MAVTEKQLRNLKPIKKGEVKNPNGARAHNPEMRRLKTITNHQIAEIGSIILEGKIADLQAIPLDQNSPTLKVWLASIIATSMKRGDPHALNIVLDRICGKIKERIELTGDQEKPIAISVASNEELKSRLTQIESDV